MLPIADGDGHSFVRLIEPDPPWEADSADKVLMSNDLADLYMVEHRALMQAVRRNIERFPGDVMFQISQAEGHDLKSQFVTSSWGGIRKLPYAVSIGVRSNYRVLRTFPEGSVSSDLVAHQGAWRRINVDNCWYSSTAVCASRET